jgi:Fe-S cluster assembly protein SufD
MTQALALDNLTQPLDAFQRQALTRADFTDALRQRGLSHFQQVGLPTTKDEEWRQTNVAPIAKTEFVLADPAATVTREQINRFAIPNLEAHELVLIDGRYSPDLSMTGELPEGVVVAGLAEAIENHRALVEPHLGQYASPEYDAFGALNAAYLDDGAFIHVPKGVTVDKPVHLIFVSTAGEQPTMSHPRTLVHVAEAGHVDVIEHHLGLEQNVYFTNAVTEVVLDKDAGASHYFIERDSEQAYNVSTLRMEQHESSSFESHTVLLGSKLVRNNVHPRFVGENAHSLLNGLYTPDDQRHMDNHMRVHHTMPNCSSRQYYTGVLRGKGSGTFIGRIVCDRPAQKTDSEQSSRGLLLSDDAYLHSRPQLEIFADDVVCTHGASIGELDEEGLFYLESRGLGKDVAQGLMVYSFAADALERMQLEPVREHMGRLLLEQLDLQTVLALMQ